MSGGDRLIYTPPKAGGYDGRNAPESEAEKQQRQQDAKEAAAKAASSANYQEQARTLQEQIDAIRKALRSEYRDSLKARLDNVATSQQDMDRRIREKYKALYGTYQGADEDNLKASSDQTAANLANRLRERHDALSQAMLQGAGESDVLRAQQLSLSNWNANQNDINRSFFDTERSINSAVTGLTQETKDARVDIASQANADREQLWTQFFNQRNEAFTQLGNLLSQQASLYGAANEAVADGGMRKKRRKATETAGEAYDAAVNQLGKTWDNPGVSDKIMDWEGSPTFEGTNNFDMVVNAPRAATTQRPEGATLRSW